MFQLKCFEFGLLNAWVQLFTRFVTVNRKSPSPLSRQLTTPPPLFFCFIDDQIKSDCNNLWNCIGLLDAWVKFSRYSFSLTGNAPPPFSYGAPQGQQQYGGPPPQGQQYGAQQQSSTSVVMMGGGGPSYIMFGDAPQPMTCTHCRAQIVTRVDYEVGGFAWLMCVILCLVG